MFIDFCVTKHFSQLVKFSRGSCNSVLNRGCNAAIIKDMTQVGKLQDILNRMAIDVEKRWFGSHGIIIEDLGFSFTKGYIQAKSSTCCMNDVEQSFCFSSGSREKYNIVCVKDPLDHFNTTETLSCSLFSVGADVGDSELKVQAPAIMELLSISDAATLTTKSK